MSGKRQLDPLLHAALRERPLRFVAVCTLLFVTAAAGAARGGDDGTASVLPVAALVLSVALMRGFVAADRQDGKWFLLFQNPVDPVRHYARVFALSLVIVIATLALIITAAAFASPTRIPLRSMLGSLAALSLFVLHIQAAAAGISAFSRKHDLEFLVLLLIVSFAIPIYAEMGPLPDYVADAVGALLLPVFELVPIQQAISGEGPAPGGPAVARVIGYPLVWLTLAAWQVRRLARGIVPVQ